MKKITILLITLILTLNSLFSEQWYALVVGNSSYNELGSLKNPVNDATDMAIELKKIGFTVTLLKDADLIKMEEGVADFKNNLSKDKDNIGLFYYAGHGVQSKGENFLIPSNARISSESYLKTRSFSVNILMDELKYANNSLNMIILDACRDNPFGWNRGGSRGLVVVGARPPGSIVVYATSEGGVASDGTGRNGLFTQELLKNLSTPNIDIKKMIDRTAAGVQEKSNGNQIPAVYSQFFGEKILVEKTVYNKPTNNITFENVELFGSLQITVDNPGDLYLDGQKVKSFKAGESTKIPKLITGGYSLEYRSNSNSESKNITITDNNITQVKFIGEVIRKQLSFSIDMVLVEAGTFQMGSNSGGSDEKPVHSVTISKDFYIGKYEVTQKQWEIVMGSNPSHFKGDNLPVEKVSWYDVVEFCNKLSQKEGLTPFYNINKSSTDSNNKNSNDDIKWTVTYNSSANGYRLPTEAQWEFAAKGGNKSRGYTYSGSNSVDSVAVYKKNSYDLGKSHKDYGTHDVGTKQANELGIFDMSGNVWEWCWDWYGSYGSSSQRDPVGDSSGSRRVLRGGSWYDSASCSRVGDRNRIGANNWYSSTGFRLVSPVQ